MADASCRITQPRRLLLVTSTCAFFRHRRPCPLIFSMYYYLSFLRPPPTEVSSIVGCVTITPQIANDLRTEPCTGAIDIFYSWALCNTPENALYVSKTTKPIKLTTWSSSSTYKELKVPLPSTARPGTSWRLVLSSSTTPRHHLIPLFDEELGPSPLPVISMPVLVTRSSTSKHGKQDEIERVFALSSHDAQFPLVIREQTSFDLDKVRTGPRVGIDDAL